MMLMMLSLLILQQMVPTIEDIYVAHVETNRGIKEQVRFYDTKGLVSYNRD